MCLTTDGFCEVRLSCARRGERVEHLWKCFCFSVRLSLNSFCVESSIECIVCVSDRWFLCCFSLSSSSQLSAVHCAVHMQLTHFSQ